MFWFDLFLALLAGCLLGAFFFGGLWWTVQLITAGRRPYLVIMASFLIRTAVVLAGFYLLLRAGWPCLFAGLAGFLAARTLLASLLKPGQTERPSS